MASSSSPASFLRTLNWAVYLGCSWTWCIGMFLPVILVSEYGTIAWFVFAIPNVLGAAAMGWTLARPGASERIVKDHRAACVFFSVVTIAFHLFFLYWLMSVRPIPLMPGSYAWIAVAAGVFFGVVGRGRIRLDFIFAWLVLCVSLTVMARGFAQPVFGVAHPIHADHAGSAMLGLAPACVLGFFLCPYLDVTFHRARQQTPPNPGKVAFGIGFGIVFLSMIVLTLMYAGDFAMDKGVADRFGSFGGQLLVTWVALHIAAQAGFTIAVHLRALPRFELGDSIFWIAGAVCVGLGIFAIRQEVWFAVPAIHLEMLSGEFVYRLFMSFYGLLFPAYVWICMVPMRGSSPGPKPRAIAVLALAVLIAMPFYWMGFFAEQMLWLIPGVVVVLTARLLVTWLEKKESQPQIHADERR